MQGMNKRLPSKCHLTHPGSWRQSREALQTGQGLSLVAGKGQSGRKRKSEGGGLRGGADSLKRTYVSAQAWPYHADCYDGSGSTLATTWCPGYLSDIE